VSESNEASYADFYLQPKWEKQGMHEESGEEISLKVHLKDRVTDCEVE
jgi:hypothetical protein